LDDLLGGAAPAAVESTAPAGDPLDDLLGDAPPAGGPHTQPAYVYMFPPKPRPAPVTPAPAEAPAEPPPAPLDDSVPPEVLAAGPDDPHADEDAWLIQELQRLAAGEPAQADAVATVASVVRMLVRKGVIQQEALLGELGR
jgi:hypothetical protein